MKLTSVLKPADVTRDWVLIDAEGKTFGRILTEVATLLAIGYTLDEITNDITGTRFISELRTKLKTYSTKAFGIKVQIGR